MTVNFLGSALANLLQASPGASVQGNPAQANPAQDNSAANLFAGLLAALLPAAPAGPIGSRTATEAAAAENDGVSQTGSSELLAPLAPAPGNLSKTGQAATTLPGARAPKKDAAPDGGLTAASLAAQPPAPAALLPAATTLGISQPPINPNLNGVTPDVTQDPQSANTVDAEAEEGPSAAGPGVSATALAAEPGVSGMPANALSAANALTADLAPIASAAAALQQAGSLPASGTQSLPDAPPPPQQPARQPNGNSATALSPVSAPVPAQDFNAPLPAVAPPSETQPVTSHGAAAAQSNGVAGPNVAASSAAAPAKPLVFAARLTENAVPSNSAATPPATAPSAPESAAQAVREQSAPQQEAQPAGAADQAALAVPDQATGAVQSPAGTAGSQQPLRAYPNAGPPAGSAAAEPATKPVEPSAQAGSGAQSGSDSAAGEKPPQQKAGAPAEVPGSNNSPNPVPGMAVPNSGSAPEVTVKPAPEKAGLPTPAPATAEPPQSAATSGPVRGVSLTIQGNASGGGAPASDVEVRVEQSAGQVQVTVHSSDEHLTQNLRDQLGDLVTRLEHSGYNAETWHPAGNAPAAETVRAAAESAWQDFRDGSNRQSGNGSGNSNGNSGQGNQGRRDREETPPEWLETIEANLGGGSGRARSTL